MSVLPGPARRKMAASGGARCAEPGVPGPRWTLGGAIGGAIGMAIGGAARRGETATGRLAAVVAITHHSGGRRQEVRQPLSCPVPSTAVDGVFAAGPCQPGTRSCRAAPRRAVQCTSWPASWPALLRSSADCSGRSGFQDQRVASRRQQTSLCGCLALSFLAWEGVEMIVP